MVVRQTLNKLLNSIGTKIIFPYVLLTIFVAGIGAFIVTNLVTGTLQERFDNQLLDSGRVVAEIMVDYEQARLAVLRAVTSTQGVPEGVKNHAIETIESLVPQIIANSDTDAVVLLDDQGIELFGWFKGFDNPGERIDYSQLEQVRLVLDGYVDESGNRRVMLTEIPKGYMLFTIGPIYLEGEQVGVVLIGTSITDMVFDLTESAIAWVSLYDTSGSVIATTISIVQDEDREILQESPQSVQSVVSNAQNQVRTRRINLHNQNYLLAYGDWRLRGQSFGMYSVALPVNFIINAAATSRNLLSFVFSMATVCVFAIGYVISQRIVSPLDQLVQTSTAVTHGDLNKRSGIDRNDEIGVLAKSFDNMTYTLELRNQQLTEQASNLTAILQSIADGIIVMDSNNQIMTANLAAEKIITDVRDTNTPENVTNLQNNDKDAVLQEWLAQLTVTDQFQRYQVGNRVFSALPAPVITPDGDRTGLVIVLRDITREVEVEQRQNSFITNVSHELRTPLTSIKGYISLMLAAGKDGIDNQNLQFAKVIDASTDVLINHVNRLMEIVEIQEGTLKFNKELISFNEIARETVQSWIDKFMEKQISCDFTSDDRRLPINADRSRLAWAIDNLLQNAYDFTPNGGAVHITIFQKNGTAHFSISDTGIGINATDQPFIFDRFYRVGNEMNYNTPGMGLGLFIVRYIIQNHAGSINIDSQPGNGSTFSIRLPLAEEP